MNKRLMVLLGIVVVALAARTWLSASPIIPHRVELASFPRELADYRATEDHVVSPDVAAVLLADDYIDRNYRSAEGRSANLFIAYYKAQKAGETMHSPKNCLPGSGWDPIVSDRVLIRNGKDKVLVNRYVTQNGPKRLLILYWYQASGHVIASEYWGKFYLIVNAIRERRRDGAIVRVTVDLLQQGGMEKATAEASRIASEVLEANRPYIP
jgi:EpsI family protein